MKLSYISKPSVYGSSAFLAVDVDNHKYTTGQTASTAYNPRNALACEGLTNKEVKKLTEDFEHRGFVRISTREFYEL